MKYSIIIPIYNVEKYLPQCIESVLAQDYDDYEIILVDDGSTDNSPKICDDYVQKDSRIQVIHKENGGLSDARNAGIKQATGEYLFFIDSDDYWDCTSVLSQVTDTLNKYPSDYVQFGLRVFQQTNDTFLPSSPRNFSKYNGMKAEQIICELVANHSFYISACVMAISRELIINNQLYFRKGIKSEDLDWAVRMYICNPTLAFIDDYFYVYREFRDGSITSTVDAKHIDDCCNNVEYSVRLAEQADGNIKFGLLSVLMYQCLVNCALCYKVPLTDEQRKEFLERLRLVCKNRICKYNLNDRVRYATVVYRLFGFKIMARVLGFYLNHRGR